ncbi:small integral membrane protein 43 isoform X1 [Cebus imitator]|uniref:small integral membrane protein 43 isoform X1 n=1 Tax=Cebus imitator TaxID=2715852 RepID=UPI001897D9D6|nr:small integral membrane protein 43 isoform X1 [Cebus imitator]
MVNGVHLVVLGLGAGERRFSGPFGGSNPFLLVILTHILATNHGLCLRIAVQEPRASALDWCIEDHSCNDSLGLRREGWNNRRGKLSAHGHSCRCRTDAIWCDSTE